MCVGIFFDKVCCVKIPCEAVTQEGNPWQDFWHPVEFPATKLKLGLETIWVLKAICVFTNSFLHTIFKLLSSIPL